MRKTEKTKQATKTGVKEDFIKRRTKGETLNKPSEEYLADRKEITIEMHKYGKYKGRMTILAYQLENKIALCLRDNIKVTILQ